MSSGEFLSLALLNHMLCYFTPSNIPKNKEEQNWNLTTGKNNIVFLYLQNIDDLTKSCNSYHTRLQTQSQKYYTSV